jgi:N-acetylmuramoyl-L-alanine amidase
MACSKLKLLPLILILFLFCVSAASAAETPLLLLMKELDITLRWHNGRTMGVLMKGRERVVFRPGEPLFIHNYANTITSDAIKNRNGVLVLPDKTETVLRDIFTIMPDSDTSPRIAAVLIDPGHGGKDPGAVGTHNVDGKKMQVMEKEVVLTVSLGLYRMLKRRFPDKDIYLTRSGDTFPTLEERVEMANRQKLVPHEAIIFVSIHANASLNKNASGFEVWYLPPEYRRELLDPESVSAEPEEILPILNTMLEEEYTVESILLAKNILHNLDVQVGSVSENRGLKEEIWFVVRKAKMPSVLVELGFVTNKNEALLLTDDKHLMKLSRGIYNGITQFIVRFEETDGFTATE